MRYSPACYFPPKKCFLLSLLCWSLPTAVQLPPLYEQISIDSIWLKKFQMSLYKLFYTVMFIVRSWPRRRRFWLHPFVNLYRLTYVCVLIIH